MSPQLVASDQPFDGERSLRRIKSLKAQLLAEAVRYAKEGATREERNTLMDRVRAASEASGVPLVFIESEAKR